MKEKFIPGIYNYCDRWCERCTFTSRCRNFATTSSLSNEQLDSNNTAFWESISSQLKKTAGLLQKAAEKYGIDLNTDPQQDGEYDREEKRIRLKLSNSVVARLATKYRKLVLAFIQQWGATISPKNSSSNQQNNVLTDFKTTLTPVDLDDCFEIIQWYVFFIDAKLQRALHGKLEGEHWEDENGFQRDSDGSAKIALIGIDRSIAAWNRLYELLPSFEDEALAILSLVSQLKTKVTEEFPKAKDFKRPGFDD